MKRKILKPKMSILNKDFKYTSPVHTDIGARFRRILREQAKAKIVVAQNVVPLVKKVRVE